MKNIDSWESRLFTLSLQIAAMINELWFLIEMCACANMPHISIRLTDSSRYPFFTWSFLKQ